MHNQETCDRWDCNHRTKEENKAWIQGFEISEKLSRKREERAFRIGYLLATLITGLVMYFLT